MIQTDDKMVSKLETISVIIIALIIFLILLTKPTGKVSGTVEITIIQAPTPPSQGPGVGGAPIAIPLVKRIANFTVDKDLIKIKLRQGKEMFYEFEINNTGNTELNVSITADLPYASAEEKVELKVDEKKIIFLRFFAPDELEPGIYTGKITIKSYPIEKIIRLIMEVESKIILLDTKIDIPYKEIKPGENLSAQLTIFNLGEIEKMNITVYYTLMDMKGKKIEEQTETLEIGKQISYMKSFVIPRLELGDYLIAMKVIYKNTVAISSQLFSVVGIPIEQHVLYSVLAIVILLIVIIHIKISRLKMRR